MINAGRIFMKNRRIALGLTMKEVAELIGVQEATYQRYESGVVKNIPYENITALSEILKCNPQDLLGLNKNVLSEEEQNLIDMYRSLPEWMQRLAAENLTALYREKQEFDRINADREKEA